MDFVVAGIGFGALLIVIGFVVRDIGPIVWRSPHTDSDIEFALDRRHKVVLCHAVSNILAVAGGIVLLATLAAVGIGVSDTVGGLIFAVSAAIAILLAASVISIAARGYLAHRPAHLGAQTGFRSPPLSTPESGALTSVRRLPKRQPEPAIAANGQSDPEAAAPDQITAYDPNRLLASEMDGEGSDDDPFLPRKPAPTPAQEPEPASELGAPAEPEPATAEAAPEPESAENTASAEPALAVEETAAAEAGPAPETEPSPETESAKDATEPSPPESQAAEGTDQVISVTVRPPAPIAVPESSDAPARDEPAATADQEPAVVGPTETSVPESAHAEVEGVFQSRLLADIGAGVADENGAGFTSSLLADVDSEADSRESGFRSPLLADLADESADRDTDDDREGESDAMAREPRRRPLFSRRNSRR